MRCFDCLNSLYVRLPGLEKNPEDPDSKKRMGISLLPVIGTIMYVFNLRRASFKYENCESDNNELGCDSRERFQNRLNRYSAYALFSNLSVVAITVAAVGLGILSLPVAYAILGTTLLSTAIITCLICTPDFLQRAMTDSSYQLNKKSSYSEAATKALTTSTSRMWAPLLEKD